MLLDEVIDTRLLWLKLQSLDSLIFGLNLDGVLRIILVDFEENGCKDVGHEEAHHLMEETSKRVRSSTLIGALKLLNKWLVSDRTLKLLNTCETARLVQNGITFRL